MTSEHGTSLLCPTAPSPSIAGDERGEKEGARQSSTGGMLRRLPTRFGNVRVENGPDERFSRPWVPTEDTLSPFPDGMPCVGGGLAVVTYKSPRPKARRVLSGSPRKSNKSSL